MKIYKEKTGRKTVKGAKKLLGVMKAEKILLYTSLIKWYLQHGLRLTAVQLMNRISKAFFMVSRGGCRCQA